MNVIRLMGGLGNQLFQYAFGKAQEFNDIDVKYDKSWFGVGRKRNYFRPYRLDRFHTNIQFSTFLNQKIITTKECDLSLLKMKNCNFDGYWQYFNYYTKVLPLLRKEFCVKEEFYSPEFLELKEKIVGSNSISVHVRRGDYIIQSGFWNLPFNYYMEGIVHTKEGDHLFIFSDDIPWCKKLFKTDYFSKEITFIELEDYLSFELMKLCKQKVIGNSTFSFWTALLNENMNDTVVAPSGWITGARELGDKERMKQADQIYYPENWIKV